VPGANGIIHAQPAFDKQTIDSLLILVPMFIIPEGGCAGKRVFFYSSKKLDSKEQVFYNACHSCVAIVLLVVLCRCFIMNLNIRKFNEME
jgi:hypothetical protein